MLLSIDTSTRYAGVALHKEGRMLASVSWRSERNHTAELVPAIDWALKRNGAAPRDLSAIALTTGPGGFSALRVGMSVAKGLALSLNIPLLGVTTLEAEAYPYAARGLLLCAVLPLGKEEVAWALYQQRRGRWGCRAEPQVASPDAVVAGAPDGTLVCGEGAAELAPLLKRRRKSAVAVAGPYTPALRLEALAALATLRLARGDRDDLATLQPFYLRRPSIGKRNEPKPVKKGQEAT